MLKWEQDNFGHYYSNHINACCFYRITDDNGLYYLAELYENKPYYGTTQLGFYLTTEMAKQRAEKREGIKAKRKINKERIA